MHLSQSQLTLHQKNILSKDNVMGQLLKTLSIQEFHTQPNLYQELTAAIIYQQISVKAADSIYLKFKDVVGWDFTYHDVLDKPYEKIKAAGLSNQKTEYIFHIAEKFKSSPNLEEELHLLPDDEIINNLTQIKGVGVWTAKMAMMFYLGRQDVFPHEDYGIVKAMQGLYDLPESKKEQIATMKTISENWKPFRSIASFYLWAWKREN